MSKEEKNLQKQFESNRQLILNTTAKLFTEKGIVNTSFSDLSKAVNLSKGTIYYYYPSKDHLVYEVMEYYFKQVSDSIFSWISEIDENTSVSDALDLLFHRMFDQPDRAKLHICLLNESIIGNHMIHKNFTDKCAEWQTMIEVGLLKTGESSEFIKRCSATVLFFIGGITFVTVISEQPLDFKGICEQISRK